MTQVFFLHFFHQTLVFLLGYPFEILFFIPKSYHGLLVCQVTQADSGFLLRHYIFWSYFSVFIFNIRLLGLKLSNFLFFSFYWFFRSHIPSYVLVNLTWLSHIIIAWISFFSVGKSLVRTSVWHGPHSFRWTTLK